MHSLDYLWPGANPSTTPSRLRIVQSRIENVELYFSRHCCRRYIYTQRETGYINGSPAEIAFALESAKMVLDIYKSLAPISVIHDSIRTVRRQQWVRIAHTESFCSEIHWIPAPTSQQQSSGHSALRAWYMAFHKSARPKLDSSLKIDCSSVLKTPSTWCN